MLNNGELYRDLGTDYFIRQNPDRLTQRLVRQLEALGHHVTLAPTEPQEAAADQHREKTVRARHQDQAGDVERCAHHHDGPEAVAPSRCVSQP